jgi:citrate synthase
MELRERVHADGLDQVIAAHTAISDVDGEHGRLVLAGRSLEELADVGFEAVVAALWRAGGVAGPTDAEALTVALGAARVRADAELWARREAWVHLPDPMAALRAAVAGLAEAEPVDLVATVAVATAGWIRSRIDAPWVRPDPSAGHVADLLRLATGAAPTTAAVDALARYLVTVCDHGMNASTFAARVVTSTGSDAVSSVVAAIGALKGPLHGGAPGPVLDMLDAIAEPEAARAWLVAELATGRRIMGMGHRVYRVRDPRAAALESALAVLERHGAVGRRLALARAVEREATALLAARHPGRALRANVEFYTAVVLEAVGVPREAFACVFACGRVAGWLAHIAEQRASGRLIRPQSRYVGAVAAGA